MTPFPQEMDWDYATEWLKNSDGIFSGYDIPQGTPKPLPSVKFRVGTTVELRVPSEDFKKAEEDKEYLLRIAEFQKVPDGSYVLRGPLYRRTKFLHGVLPKKENEVARITESATVSSEHVIRTWRLIHTNRPFPEVRKVGHDGWLVCRWVYEIDDTGKGKKRKGFVRRLYEWEADEHYRVSDRSLREKWRGFNVQKAKKEEKKNPAMSMVTEDLERGERSYFVRKKKYTFADAFCGGGGASIGAHQAGFRIKWAFDKDKSARDTYIRNLPYVQFYHAEADNFLALSDAETVDLLHLSPPCQTFSPAHTIEGRNDDANEAALFAIGSCLDLVRPRFATLEETFGILHDKHIKHFRTLLHMFTDLGWSVAFQVLNSVEYGVAQRRERLFVVAASPGEELPPWPTATHYRNWPPRDEDQPISNLKPPITLESVLKKIPHNAEDQDFRPFEFPREPYDPAAPFSCTIRAGGGEYDIYPDGSRPFTIRELAMIQGFPVDFQFFENERRKKGQLTYKRRIVGNAVPPPLGKAVFSAILDWMEEVDSKKDIKRGSSR